MLGQRMNFVNDACFASDDELAADCPDRKRPRLSASAVHEVLNTSFMLEERANDNGEREIIKPAAGMSPLDDAATTTPPETMQERERRQAERKAKGVHWLAMLNARTYGRLFISPVEALYLIESGKLCVAGHTIETLWRFFVQHQGAKSLVQRYFTYAYVFFCSNCIFSAFYVSLRYEFCDLDALEKAKSKLFVKHFTHRAQSELRWMNLHLDTFFFTHNEEK